MNSLRDLPSVDRVLRDLEDLQVPRTMLVNEIRAVLEECRSRVRQPPGLSRALRPADEVRNRIERLLSPSLRPVINATGVILHTNLGRAPLADFHPIPRYSNLEYDLRTGRRGKRDVHTAALLLALLERNAIVVNNNAAAVFLVLNELAAGHDERRCQQATALQVFQKRGHSLVEARAELLFHPYHAAQVGAVHVQAARSK